MDRQTLARIAVYLSVSPALCHRLFLVAFSCLPCGVWQGKDPRWWCVLLAPTMMRLRGPGGRSRFGVGKYVVWRPRMD